MFADRDIEIIAAPDGRWDPVRDCASSVSYSNSIFKNFK